MTRLSELKDYAEDLTNKLEHVNVLIQEEIEEREKEEEWPKYGDTYWTVSFINWKGGTFTHEKEWTDSGEDEDRRAFNMVFRTQEEADRFLKRSLVVAELERMADGGCHFIEYSNGFDVDYLSSCVDSPWRFSSESKAQEAIDTLGEEKLKLIYNIGESDGRQQTSDY